MSDALFTSPWHHFKNYKSSLQDDVQQQAVSDDIIACPHEKGHWCVSQQTAATSTIISAACMTLRHI